LTDKGANEEAKNYFHFGIPILVQYATVFNYNNFEWRGTTVIIHQFNAKKEANYGT
jgi:hypothetical protein